MYVIHDSLARSWVGLQQREGEDRRTRKGQMTPTSVGCDEDSGLCSRWMGATRGLWTGHTLVVTWTFNAEGG